MADKSDKKKKGDAKGKKGKDAGAGAGRPSVAGHPRARASVRRVKGLGGLAGFVVGALLAHSAGLSVTSTLERALICGIGSYLLAWGAGRQTTPRARRDTHPARRVGNPARHTRRLIRARRVAVPPPVWRKWAAMNRSESRLAALARVALADGPESRLLAKVRALRALLAAGGRSPLSRGRLLDELRDIAEGEHVTARGVDAQLQACDILRALEAGPRAADELERDPFFPLMVDVLVADELDLRVSPREWRAGSARTRRVAAVVDRLMGEPDPEVAFHEWAARQRARRAA